MVRIHAREPNKGKQMKVVEHNGIWLVIDNNGFKLAGPFDTQLEAWKWVDQHDELDESLVETNNRVRQASLANYRFV